MKFSELEQLTLTELEQLTPFDLESDSLEVLKRYRNSKLPLTPELVKKLIDMSALFPEPERAKFFSVKTAADLFLLLNGLIDFCKKTGLDDLLQKNLLPFIQEVLDALKSLT